MMICKNCKNEIKHGISFCPKCGVRIVQETPPIINTKEKSTSFALPISLIALGTSVITFVLLLLRYLNIL